MCSFTCRNPCNKALLIDPKTNYSTVSAAFPKLYEGLKTVNSADLFCTSHQVLEFVPLETFERCIPSQEVCEAIEEACQNNRHEIVQLIRLMISKIADGFDVQHGALFKFGTHADDDSGSLFKIADATTDEIEKLNKTTVHNLSEERSVGSINNELKIRGKKNLESASQKIDT